MNPPQVNIIGLFEGASASEKGKSWQFFEPLKFLGDGNGGAIPLVYFFSCS